MTLINVFSCEPENQQHLIDAWVQATEQTLGKLPGIISAALHRSKDGTRVVNYAQWKSSENWENLFRIGSNSWFGEMGKYAKPDAHLYEVSYMLDRSNELSDLNAEVREFFDGYERANTDFDVERIAALYANVFMFGDPQGVKSVKKEDFVTVLPRRKEFLKSVGLVSSKIESLVASNLDSKCVLVKAVWKMRFEHSTRGPVDSHNSATYILSAVGDSFQIVFQLDHQDLMKKVQDLGLK